MESIPELDKHIEDQLKSEEEVSKIKKEEEEESEVDLPLTVRSPKSPTAESEKSAEGPKSATPFGEFLDIMEVF